MGSRMGETMIYVYAGGDDLVQTKYCSDESMRIAGACP